VKLWQRQRLFGELDLEALIEWQAAGPRVLAVPDRRIAEFLRDIDRLGGFFDSCGAVLRNR